MSRTALIGHTGFVGGTLARAARFDAAYNSTSIGDIAGETFGLVVCAGVSAVKWRANKEPEADRAGIARLTAALEGARIAELVLVSTVDVYPDPAGRADEATEIDRDANHAYGRHRLGLEDWCRARFPLVRVVRLPALFGPGLRKNVLFDLMTGHMLDAINPASVFQWYPLARLWSDIRLVRAAGLELVNLMPEPLATARILAGAFPGVRTGPAVEPAPRYDTLTRHAAVFGGSAPYVMDADAVLAALQGYVAKTGGP